MYAEYEIYIINNVFYHYMILLSLSNNVIENSIYRLNIVLNYMLMSI